MAIRGLSLGSAAPLPALQGCYLILKRERPSNQLQSRISERLSGRTLSVDVTQFSPLITEHKRELSHTNLTGGGRWRTLGLYLPSSPERPAWETLGGARLHVLFFKVKVDRVICMPKIRGFRGSEEICYVLDTCSWRGRGRGGGSESSDLLKHHGKDKVKHRTHNIGCSKRPPWSLSFFFPIDLKTNVCFVVLTDLAGVWLIASDTVSVQWCLPYILRTTPHPDPHRPACQKMVSYTDQHRAHIRKCAVNIC